jgi:hypothetical protein
MPYPPTSEIKEDDKYDKAMHIERSFRGKVIE